jgi:hypothetical protein
MGCNESYTFILFQDDMRTSLLSLLRFSFLFVLVMQVLQANAMPPGSITGRIFADFNLDGLDNDNGPGLAGVVITAFDETGQVATITSTATGSFTISGLTDGKKYRLEYSLPTTLNGYSSSFFGSAAKTTVQFVTSPADNVNQGFSAPEDFCQPNPFALVPCYINGDPLGGGTANDSALVAIPYAASGQGQTANTYVATSAGIGATWGVAYQRETKTSFMGSVLKRHAGFGPGGTGAIYVRGVNNVGSPVDLGWFSLDSLGINTGTDPRIVEPLPVNKIDPSFDSTAFGLVGKMSFGDVEISSDGKYLYAVNLFDKTLLKIFINNPYVKPTAADITVIPFTNPGCTVANDWAPWGLKVYRGEVYAGLVCTAESTQDTTQMRAHVMKLSSSNTWSPVFDFGLTFERGVIIDNTPAFNNWYAWTNDPVKVFNNFKFIYPQPILSDIEFDVDGSLILGFADRLGMQGGFLNYGPTASQGFPITTFAGGDLIRVCKIGGTFVLEGDGSSCETSGGAAQAEGPNGSEFYWTDAFADPSTNPAAFRTHNEINLGALSILPGSGEVLSAVFDPFAFNTNGLTYYSNTTGARSHSYEVFPDAPGFFGKANGLGDIELLCNAAPIEKGNFVWKDTDMDGIQDPNESPIPGVNVSIVNTSCQILATAVTNAQGEYYFNNTLFPSLNMQTDSTYYIVVGTSGQFSTSTNLLFDSLQVTVSNTGAAPSNDINDSDGVTTGGVCFAGLPFATVTIGGSGYVNHTCDFGFFVEPCDIVWNTAYHVDEVCAGDQNGEVYGLAQTTDPAGVEYSLDGGPYSPTNEFLSLPPGTYTILARVVGKPDCSIDTMLTVLPGLALLPPTGITNDTICQYLTPVAGSGLRATPTPCPTGYGAAEVKWYATDTSSTVLATGNVFNPVLAGIINTNTPGTFTYYAESNCAPCVSVRVPVSFIVHPAPVPVVLGDTLPCPNQTVTYTTVLNAGSTYTWQLIGPGTVISTAQNVFTVQMPDSSNVPPITIRVTETNQFGCVATDDLAVRVRNVTLLCDNQVQISLDDNCCTKVHPSQVLAGNYPSYDFTVTITTAAGVPVAGDSICGAGNYIVTVREMCSNNSCWANVKAEDKLPPVINCQPLSFPCSYTDTHVVLPNLVGNPVFAQPFGAIGGVVINDNCGLADISYSDDFVKFDCDTLFGVVSGKLFRTWFATDKSGNTGICTQEITYLRQPVTNIGWPIDTVLACGSTTSVHPNTTGHPTLAGVPLNFDTHTFCDIDVTYSDNGQNVCTGTRKIIRTWTVFDWCKPLNASNPNIPLNPLTHIQLITVKDSVAPVYMCPADLTVSTEPTSCLAIVNLPDVIASDACARVASGLAITPTANITGVLSNFPGNNLWAPDTMVVFGTIQNLEIGLHPITYRITDDCGNIANCTFKIQVVDAIQPVAVCHDVVKVSISSDGTALVNASSFDNGSSDNCFPVKFKARRMNTSTCVPNTDLFDDKVKFCCSDIGDSVLVVFRAYDVTPFAGAVSQSHLEDHSNDCMVRVVVEDKLPPAITCPSNITVNCNNFDPSLWAYGQPIVSDNCGLDTVTWVGNFAQFDTVCDHGIIRKSYTAIDNYGNTNTCTQRIVVNRLLGFTVRWPDDVTITQCHALATAGKPVIGNVVCGLPGVSFTDEIVTLVPDACYKIIRKWRVQDICENVTNLTPLLVLNPQNSNLGPTSIADANNRGYLEYNQVIKVVDSEKPLILNCPDTVVVINDLSSNDPTLYNNSLYWDPIHQSHDLCEAPAPLSIKVTDVCSGANVQVAFTLLLDLNNDGVMETSILSNSNGAPVLDQVVDTTVRTVTFNSQYQIPHGRHKIKWLMSDGCGNEATCEYTFVIRDGKAPTIVCRNGIAVNIMQSGMIEMWASDFLQYGQDNCTPAGLLEYGVRESGVPGTDFPTTQNVLFDCDDLGTKLVKLYGRDKGGNYDFCETYILVQDNIGACSTLKANVAGSLKTDLQKAIDQSQVTITGQNNALPNPSMFTNSTGTYLFNAIPLGDNYQIAVKRGGFWTNGVNTLDILKIQRHILGLEPITIPYRQVAADANRTGSVTSADIVALRRLILGASDTIPGNTSWRFIEKKHQFTNPNNPFTAPIPERISIANLQQQLTDGDFVGVKTGDVTGDAVPNVQATTDDRTESKPIVLATPNIQFAEGETLIVPVIIAENSKGQTLQFTLRTDSRLLQVVDFQPNAASGFSDEHFSMHRSADGLVTIAFDADAPLKIGTELFSITLRSKGQGSLAAGLSLSNEITQVAGFDVEGNRYDLALRLNQQTLAPVFEVYQNTPNPFIDQTSVGVLLPDASNVKLTVFDGTGRTVYIVEKELSKGLHIIELLSGSLPVQGLLYYRVESAFGSVERKMIRVNR